MFRRSSGLSAGKYPVPNLDLNYATTGALSGIETFARTSSAWAFNSARVLTQHTTNLPRFDYDPVTAAPRGLLIEEQRTNSIRNPRCEGATAGTPGTAPTYWIFNTAANLTRSIMGVGTEDGIPYVEVRFQFASGGATSYSLYPDSVSGAANSGVAFSAYLRLISGASPAIWLGFQDGATTFSGVAITPTTAALREQRYSRTLTTGATATLWRGTINFTLNSSLSYDFILRIGLPQLELGAFASSPILPPAGLLAAASRSADVCTIPVSAFEFNASEGTLFAEFLRTASTNSQQGRVASLSNGSNNNLIEVYHTGAASPFGQISNAGAVQAQFTTASGATEVAQRAALAWATNDFAFCAGAGTMQTDTSGTVPTVTSLRVGDRWDGLRNLNGYVRRITCYPRRLDNATLARIMS